MTLQEVLDYIKGTDVKKFNKLDNQFKDSFEEIFKNKDFTSVTRAILAQPNILFNMVIDPSKAISETFVSAFKFGFLLATLMERESIDKANSNLR